ncbi:cytochrome P450 [Nocardia nepalensis]|uniref:cytochrome P450 n=1 Tax=Nocardia nepalensis TaxID=3375448 RepID=UPI003B680B91
MTSLDGSTRTNTSPTAVGDRAWRLLRLASSGRDAVSFTAGGERNVLLNHPDYAKHVLGTNRDNYTKDTGPNRFFKTRVADGILTADGERWRHQRTVVNPAFKETPRVLDAAHECLAAAIERMDHAAETGAPVNLTAEMGQVTLGITTRALFGLDHAQFMAHCTDIGALLDASASLLPTECPAVQHDPREALFDAVRRAVARIDDDSRGPALEAVLADPGHPGDAVAHQIVTLLLAGYETTANSLTWAWILLGRNVSTYREWQRELDAGDEKKFTKAIFDETLRLYPSAWVIGRRAIAADRVGELTIPAGASITISPFLLHRHPGFWADADRFDPGRFRPGGHRPGHRYAYIPFGGGPRFCIGSGYALAEAHLILSTLGRRYTFAATDDGEPKPTHKFVLRAPDPYSVLVQRRR